VKTVARIDVCPYFTVDFLKDDYLNFFKLGMPVAHVRGYQLAETEEKKRTSRFLGSRYAR
jgi:hypothetical protein